eukprot:TRINITY_DN65915_c9_g3_i1.p1 TRINITY_DN65915_c9_g3~~TRINITY_DN65915_c9_g3_i1.p1  ORF type:complete len:571 (+),score=244.48 TRINITY_DN65915_c9_g3_i1:190-1713(+)
MMGRRFNWFNLRPRPGYVFFIVFFEMFVLMLFAPALVNIKYDFFGKSYSRASLISGVFDATGALVSLMLTPVFGSLSDDHGRKFFILISACGMVLQSAVLALGVNLWFYMATRLFNVSALGLCFAYAADCTTKAERSRNFGYALATMFLGMIAGPIVSATLSTEDGFRIATLLGFVNLAFIAFIVPESIGERSRTHFREVQQAREAQEEQQRNNQQQPKQEAAESTDDSDADRTIVVDSTSKLLPDDQVGADSVLLDLSPPPLKRQVSMNPFVSIKYLTRKPFLRTIGLVTFFSTLAENGIIETLLIFLKKHLHFDKDDNADLLLVIGISAFSVMLCFYPLMLKAFQERRIITFAIFVNMVRFSLYCFIDRKYEALVLESFSGFSFVSFPACSSYVSKNVSSREQGLAAGALAGIRGMTSGLGPLLFSGLFSLFTSSRVPFEFPQAPCALAAVSLFVAVVLSLQLPNLDPVKRARTVAPSADKLTSGGAVVGGTAGDKNPRLMTVKI